MNPNPRKTKRVGKYLVHNGGDHTWVSAEDHITVQARQRLTDGIPGVVLVVQSDTYSVGVPGCMDFNAAAELVSTYDDF